MVPLVICCARTGRTNRRTNVRIRIVMRMTESCKTETVEAYCRQVWRFNRFARDCVRQKCPDAASKARIWMKTRLLDGNSRLQALRCVVVPHAARSIVRRQLPVDRQHRDAMDDRPDEPGEHDRIVAPHKALALLGHERLDQRLERAL